jgi:hypothetical protein
MKICEVCGTMDGKIINSQKFNKTLCYKHYQQMQQHGKILERTKYDRNDIIIKEDIAEIIIRNKDGTEICRSIIDTEHINAISKYKWCAGGNGYIISRPDYKAKALILHRVLTNAPDGMVVDHINHNRMDNRLSNLRVCTEQQNMCNQRLRVDNTSGYKGVYWDKTVGKWHAQISVNNVIINLGYSVSLQECVRIRASAETKYQGEYALKTN